MKVLVIPNMVPGIPKALINNAPIKEINNGYLNLSIIGKSIFIVNRDNKNHNPQSGSKNNIMFTSLAMIIKHIFQIIENRKNGIINLLKDLIGSSGPIFEKYPATKKNIGK